MKLSYQQKRMAQTLGLNHAQARIAAHCANRGRLTANVAGLGGSGGYTTEDVDADAELRKVVADQLASFARAGTDEEIARKAVKRTLKDAGASDETIARLMADEDLDGEDLDDSDADDEAYPGGPMKETALRMKQRSGFAVDITTDEMVEARVAKHIENGCDEDEARRLAQLDDDALADEVDAGRDDSDDDADADSEESDEDSAKGDAEELAAAVERQRRFGPTKLTRRQEVLLERNGILQAYGMVAKNGKRLMCRGGICWAVGTAGASCACKGAA